MDLRNESADDKGKKFEEMLQKKMSRCGTECLLNDRSIGDDEVDIIVRELTKHSQIIKLDLVGNFIGDEGCRKLARLLSSPACSITDVDLYGNRIGDAGAEALSEAIRATDKLSVVDLRANPLGMDGKKALVAAKAQRPAAAIYYDAMPASGTTGGLRSFAQCPAVSCSVC